MSESNNENHPVAIPISEPEFTSNTTSTSTNTINIREPQLYDIEPNAVVQLMNNDIQIRALQMSMMQTEIEDFLKGEIYQRVKMVKIISIIDIFFLTLNLIYSILNKNLFFLFFGLCPMCISGYYGANTYNKCYVMGYIVYLFIMDVYYFMLFIYYSNFLILIFCFIESYFLIYTFRLYNCLGRAKEETIESLRDGWVPIVTVVYH